MIRLRPYKPCDARYIVNWISDEKSFYQWSADRINSYPINEQKLNKCYEQEINNDKFWQMTAIDDSGVPIGHLIMRYIDGDINNLRFGNIIVNPEIRGKGYGKEMLQIAIHYAFDILKVKRISLGVFTNNMGAYHCYGAAGFCDTQERDVYEILNEKWECIEMEIVMEQNSQV